MEEIHKSLGAASINLFVLVGCLRFVLIREKAVSELGTRRWKSIDYTDENTGTGHWQIHNVYCAIMARLFCAIVTS